MPENNSGSMRGKVFAFIREYAATHDGDIPTRGQIAEACGCTSHTASTHRHAFTHPEYVRDQRRASKKWQKKKMERDPEYAAKIRAMNARNARDRRARKKGEKEGAR